MWSTTNWFITGETAGGKSLCQQFDTSVGFSRWRGLTRLYYVHFSLNVLILSLVSSALSTHATIYLVLRSEKKNKEKKETIQWLIHRAALSCIMKQSRHGSRLASVFRGFWMCLLKAVKPIPNEITLTRKRRDGISEASELQLNDCGHTSLFSPFHSLIKVIRWALLSIGCKKNRLGW